jgi:prepilin-type N-terminal cleavage/methylation domain-containing protein
LAPSSRFAPLIRDDRGFNIIELALVLVIIGLLAAGAIPLYLGYSQDAKTVEAKMVAASVWTALTTNALVACGTPVAVSAGYPKAGLDGTGTSTPTRWSVGDGAKTVTADCATGALSPDGDVFTISGTAEDVNAIQIKLTYSAAATPPSRLRCSGNAGLSFSDC